jgi:hypothetical protein
MKPAGLIHSSRASSVTPCVEPFLTLLPQNQLVARLYIGVARAGLNIRTANLTVLPAQGSCELGARSENIHFIE